MTRKIKIVQFGFETQGDLDNTYSILWALGEDGRLPQRFGNKIDAQAFFQQIFCELVEQH